MDMDLPQEFNSAGPVEPPRPGKNPDAIKLFVGQVPKTFEEKDLLPYLERYGAIHELSVLRDKLSHAHKGLPGGVQACLYGCCGPVGAFIDACHSTRHLSVNVRSAGDGFPLQDAPL